MLIIPAIDLMGGDAVRLERGEKNSRTVVGKPLELIDRFARAELVHVVDLDGAFAGKPQQTALIAELARRHPVQVGGGIRTDDDIAQLIEAGAARVVLATAALKNPALLDRALARYGADKIVVALDVKEGKVAISGWVDKSDFAPTDAARAMAERGVIHVLSTAVHKDGMLEGPDLQLLDELRAADWRLNVIASGGISSLADLRALKAHDVRAAIVGKALYAGRFTLEEALAC